MELNMNHLAMILDGNRRWGKARGIKMSVNFYIQSGLLGLDVAEAAFDRGIDNLTIWIGSVSNLTKRPALEIMALNKAYKKFFADPKNLELAHNRRIKVDCFGRWRDLLEPATVKVIEQTMADTAGYADSGKRMTVLIGYDGTEERGAALQKVLKNHNGPKDDLITSANLLRQNSWTGHLPDVDLVIRTGVDDDPHNSAGFLSMLVDNTQYAFLGTLWPDFTPEMLNQILDDFAARERRMGK
ncbi:MAG: undecaprenyl diphosphate synthase family protein [Candidatus Nomurabacteria bacterium]|jgi:undecaprenyl diphosphate synthase|nr:undecaprenyl diphosphate synthase family protein [Candidatus Nomurabacteria bacterium]